MLASYQAFGQAQSSFFTDWTSVLIWMKSSRAFHKDCVQRKIRRAHERDSPMKKEDQIRW